MTADNLIGRPTAQGLVDGRKRTFYNFANRVGFVSISPLGASILEEWDEVPVLSSDNSKDVPKGPKVESPEV